MTTDRRFTFDKAAKLDSPQRRERQPPGPLVELIASWRPSVILDIGVGTGYFAIPLAQAAPGAAIVGLDVEPRMFDVVQERAQEAGCGERITLIQTSPDGLALDRTDFDVALMVALYHELDQRPEYLTRVREALAPGGRLVLCDWRLEEAPEVGPPNSHRVPQEQAERDLSAAGFVSVEHHELYASHYLLVAQQQ